MAENKNAINEYKCVNGHTIVTINREQGTTPMFITCDTCQKQMSSRMYMVDQSTDPTHEWYKPTKDECKADAVAYAHKHNIHSENVIAGFLEHLRMGGLFLRKIEQ